MAALFLVDSSQHAMHESGSQRSSEDKPDDGGHWYYSRKEIEENSPSRRDGVELKKETYLRRSYCTFLQDLGMRLKVPQVTIATAIVFCHRFFLRQSHAKNDRRIIAVVCMFLAGKVEETPRPLKDVILVSYEIIHKKDPTAVQRIKQKEIYEQQKELLLLGERSVLTTLAFDLNLSHPYKPLVDVIKKFKVAQNTLAQVAWNFVNDGLRTSLCLQFKPHHIAAGAIFLATKFLKVKLSSDGDKVWWQEFDVTRRQLEGWFSPSFGRRCQCTKIISLNQQELEKVSNQMLELYKHNKLPPSQASKAEGNADVAGVSHQASQAAPDNLVANDDGGSLQTSQVQEKDAHKVEQPQYNGNKVNGSEDIEKERDQGRNESIKRIDKDKVKAALEKQRKSRGGGGGDGDARRKNDLMDEDDLIERELEDGIELAADSEKINQQHLDNVKEGLEAVDDEAAHDYSRSVKSENRKRKRPDSPSEVRKPHSPENHSHRNEHEQDRNRIVKSSHQENDQKRHKQEKHFPTTTD